MGRNAKVIGGNIAFGIELLLMMTLTAASILVGFKIWQGSKNQFALVLCSSVLILSVFGSAESTYYLVTQKGLSGEKSFVAIQLETLTFGIQLWLISKKYYTSSLLFTSNITQTDESRINRYFNILFGACSFVWIFVTIMF